MLLLYGHSTVFRLLQNLNSEPFGVAYLKIYAREQNNTTSNLYNSADLSMEDTSVLLDIFSFGN